MATEGIPLRARILLVDDRVETRVSLARLLAHAGYEVQDAADIVEALARLRALPFDGVVTDVRLESHDDGLRLLRTVREELPHLPVVLYSGFARTADAVLAIKLGTADYLELPIDPDEILLAVSNAVESRRSPRILGQEQSLTALPYGIIAAREARLVMRKYHWPGNVRELRSVLEHTLGLANGDTITERDVIAALGSSSLDTAIGDSNSHEYLRDKLISALERHHWKIGRSAAALGISRSTLWRHLKKHGIRELRQ
jgi:DNA-binding NtrC family response regulator